MAVTDPNQFQFDDNLMGADEGAPNAEEMPPRDSERMRIVQSK